MDTKEILNKCEEYEIIGRRAEANISDKGTAIQTLISTVQNFAESMRVVDYLNCDKLDKNHWERIQKLFDEDTFLLRTKDYTLEKLLSIKAYTFEKEIRACGLSIPRRSMGKDTLVPHQTRSCSHLRLPDADDLRHGHKQE